MEKFNDEGDFGEDDAKIYTSTDFYTRQIFVSSLEVVRLEHFFSFL